MEYFVAESYKNWERVGEPYKKKDKLFTKVKHKCDRCTKGVYVSRIENGQPVPHPAYGGICLKCNGIGYLTKEVRLYNEKEHQANLKAAERREEKRIAEQEELKAKALEEASEKRAKWLEDEAFSEDGFTFCYVMQDSYARKSELKEAGFKYNPNLGWHRTIADGFEEGVIRISVDDVADFSAWGAGTYRASAKKFVRDAANSILPISKSNWVGEEGEKIKGIKAQIISIYGYEGRWGYTNNITFKSGDNLFKWFTSTNVLFKVGDDVTISGTIKEHAESCGEKYTKLTRCKLTAI